MGLNKIIGSIFGSKADRDMKLVQPYLEKVLAVEPEIIILSNDGLRERADNLKFGIKEFIKEDQNEINQLKEKAESLDIWEREDIFNEIDKIEEKIDEKLEGHLLSILPEAFAIVKDTARRFKENQEIEVTASEFDRYLATSHDFVDIKGDKASWKNSWVAGGNKIVWDMVHYDVQIIGGVALHQGKIAEMATGEGKTLVATFPVFLNALTGRGVHLVTVNDYLAKRDTEWMGPIYMFHGLSVDCVDKHEPNSDNRRKAYAADITFGTNNEFGFDYLRDNMALSPTDLVQRKHNYAIVDEVDSVLIDDARTPLIISGPTPKGEDQLFDELKPQVQKLVNAQKTLFNTIFADAKKLLASGNEKDGGFKLLQSYKALPKTKPLIKFLSEQGMKALLQKTENQYMADNNKNMHLVTDELFFVIDERLNSIEPTDRGFDLLTSSADDSNFFVLPDISVELTKVDNSQVSDNDKLKQKDQIISDYSIKSERIHTVNQLLKAYTLFEIDVEYVVIDNKVKIVDEQTGRIMEGRRYSDGLHQAIEAKENVKIEAATQTYATITLQNYFRMYHKLAGMTGTAETEAGEFWDIYKLDVMVIPTNRPITRGDFEDLVYKTTREKYSAVINEVEKLIKVGRPVLVGTTSVEVSELLSKILARKGIKHNVLNAKLHKKEADIVVEAGYSSNVTIATNMAGRGTDIKLSDTVKAAGGLAIVGTERHESRRVDRQLRGRAGRQGDPGSSQFFVSLEDDLMRLFGSDRIAKMMDRMGLKDGEVIQHSMISKSIERAQKKVEENNFGVRKRLLEYDDVMNSQRTVIYKKRRNALDGERLGADIANMIYDLCVSFAEEYYGFLDYDELKLETYRILSIQLNLSEQEYAALSNTEFVEYLYENLRETHKRKSETIANQAYPVIKTVYENNASQYENILVPVSDGKKVYNVVVNLEKTYNTQGAEIVVAYNKTVVLKTIDDFWKEHLREMDDLRQSVQSASYEQKDPLLIYKLESFNLFKTMLDKINKLVVVTLMKGYIPVENAEQVKEARVKSKLDLSKMKTGREDPGYNDPSKGKSKSEPVRVEKKVGRNDPCPCGSGKKYKHCHGLNE
ncbi:MAG: preprotein translocase subunit SecA [Bacteroidales bacterium]|nr:preprotein translocase subunit SecA [Bacteroidales bacterium]MDD4215918.1 preprotein translocase subunit SecA [Bacteroidales bacterium]MDY0141177.1 preprotein translocase subunit SecA [Bacteroidales bacterium]